MFFFFQTRGVIRLNKISPKKKVKFDPIFCKFLPTKKKKSAKFSPAAQVTFDFGHKVSQNNCKTCFMSCTIHILYVLAFKWYIT